jgi:hypothetical protein
VVAYLDQNTRLAASRVITGIVLASTHPDFVMSLATATTLPFSLCRAISDYLTYVFVYGLTDEERQNHFAWAQAKMLTGL